MLSERTRALRTEPRVTASASWRKRPGAWNDSIMRGNLRALLSTEADRLRTELPSASSSDDAQATVKHVTYLLDQVDVWEAQPKSLWKWLREWWTGEGSSRAWLQLAEAEAELAATLPDEIAICRLPEALADARREIGDDDDPAIRESTSLYFETYGGGSSTDRPAHRRAPQVLARLLRRCCAVVFDRQAQSLTLRNRIFRVMVVTIVILLALLWITTVARLHLGA